MSTHTHQRVDPAKLKALRGDRTLAEVARALGIGISRLSNWENGHKRPPSDMLLTLLAYYRADPRDVTREVVA